ncbi:hypothetical protein IW15_14060 [Chryseobacterium soli]|uniref:Uncharacterized protein n=1 Tax=Chryseobacterium soli TaxID=445961 RepID=A0A086A553_9FLAO|nr:hypothetical protein [Chryseobacterium soli]KFF11817.1 hypothetical protein IW15_14060 [Chryseobacterium soli]
MKKKIRYTKRDKKTTLDETQLHENITYLKHIYTGERLEKTEHYHKGVIYCISFYFADEKINDEEILFENIFLNGVNIIREKQLGTCKLVHERCYNKLLLEKDFFRVEDAQRRVISMYHHSKEEYHNQKTVYSDSNEKLNFYYFDTGIPLLKKEEIERQLQEFSALHQLEVSSSYYLNFFPFTPSGDTPEIETCTYYSGFGEEREITLQQAFFEKSFIKKGYTNGTLKRIEHFVKFKISAISYFIEEGESVALTEQYTELHYVEEKKNGFTKWKIEQYRNGVLNETLIKVVDLLGKCIFLKCTDQHGNIESCTKYAYYYDSKYSPLDSFTYDSTGRLASETIYEEDGWHGTDHTIQDLKDSGFFDSEYGKYFLSASPEIPELLNPVVSYQLVYKNHLDEIITKSETENLYEYSVESFENGKLVKRINAKAVSKEDFKDKHYIEYIESYHDEVKEITDLAHFTDGRNKIYYNKRKQNNYIIYDFIVRNDDTWSIVKFTGTAVYDNYFRLVSSVTYDAASGNLVSGTKIFYPHISPLLGSDGITVNFNNRGEAVSYTERSLGRPRFFSRELFEKEYFFNVSPVNNEYYRNIEDLIPGKEAFPFFDFKLEKIQYAQEGSHLQTVELLTHHSKLKVAFLGTYNMYYFLEDGEKLETYTNTLHKEFSNVFFYHIEKKKGIIEADCFYPMGIDAHFTIDVETRAIHCDIITPKDEVRFRLFKTTEFSELYSFWHGEERLWTLDFEAEILIELLLKT